MAEQIFIIEDGTLTKFECDDYVEVVCIPDCVKNIGYRELQFLPYWDPVPFGRPVIIYGKPGSEAERYTKDNHWRFNEHITEFREIKTDAGKLEGES